MYRPTRYETVIAAPDGARYLLFYSARASLPGLLSCLRQRGAELCEIIGADDSATVSKIRGGRFPAMSFGNGWTAEYSGRTQLQARGEGELPWIFEPAPRS